VSCLRRSSVLGRRRGAGGASLSSARSREPSVDGAPSRTPFSPSPRPTTTMTAAPTDAPPPPIAVLDLRFGHPGAARPLLDGFTLSLPAGARCLLVGANGAGA